MGVKELKEALSFNFIGVKMSVKVALIIVCCRNLNFAIEQAD